MSNLTIHVSNLGVLLSNLAIRLSNLSRPTSNSAAPTCSNDFWTLRIARLVARLAGELPVRRTHHLDAIAPLAADPNDGITDTLIGATED
jgi:hypothetical protein